MSEINDLLRRLEEAKEVAQEIEQLKTRTQEKERRLVELLGPAASLGNVAGAPPRSGERIESGRLTKEIANVFKRNKGKILSAEDVGALLGETRISEIRSLFARLERRGEIKRAARGRYTAS